LYQIFLAAVGSVSLSVLANYQAIGGACSDQPFIAAAIRLAAAVMPASRHASMKANRS